MSNLAASFTVYTHPRIIAIILLGFVSGLPLALTLGTLTIWLTEVGVSKTAIGLFAAIGTPYALKFLWAPFVDNLPIPLLSKKLGRRRGWMITTQIALIIAIIGLGFSHPEINPFHTAIWALLVAICSATQDIVIDAYRVEFLTEEQQGAGAAAIVFGYRIGMLASGAGALFLAESLSWQLTYAIMATGIGVGIATVLIAGEPENTTTKPKGKLKLSEWLTKAIINPFTDFSKRANWCIILIFVVLYKIGDAMAGVMTGPFLIEIAFTKSEIATVVKTFGLFATLAGAFLGGTLVHRYGIMKSLLFCGILQMLSNLMFAVQAAAGHNLALLAVTIGLENLAGGMGTAAFVAYLSSLCNLSYTATQYALLSAFAATGRTWLSTPAGWFAESLGWIPFFLLTTIIALPGLILWKILDKNADRKP